MGKNSHKFMTESGKPRGTRAQILLQVYTFSSYKRAENHVSMTCGEEGKQKLIRGASRK